MTRLVVHAGMSKTGTTALQAFFWHNREQLAEHGLTYCEGFRRHNHAELAVAFSSKVTPLTRLEGVRAPDDRTELRERLREILGDPTAAPAFLTSSEHLSTLVREAPDVQELADFLRSLYDEVTVLFVIRRSDYWTPSAYVEAVKAGYRLPFDDDFIARRWFVLDQQAMLERWAAAFGADNVRAIPFLESDKADPRLLPDRVLAAAGIPEGTADDWPRPPKVANTSLSGYGTEVLRHFSIRLHGKSSPMRVMSKRAPIAAAVRENWPGPSPSLTPEAADELRRRGWLRTGIEATPHAIGPDAWKSWVDQSDAPTAPLPDVAPGDVAKLIRLLRKQGVVDLRWTDKVRRRSRRLLQRQR